MFLGTLSRLVSKASSRESNMSPIQVSPPMRNSTVAELARMRNWIDNYPHSYLDTLDCYPDSYMDRHLEICLDRYRDNYSGDLST